MSMKKHDIKAGGKKRYQYLKLNLNLHNFQEEALCELFVSPLAWLISVGY